VWIIGFGNMQFMIHFAAFGWIITQYFVRMFPLASIWCKACDLFESGKTIRNNLKKMVESCYLLSLILTSTLILFLLWDM